MVGSTAIRWRAAFAVLLVAVGTVFFGAQVGIAQETPVAEETSVAAPAEEAAATPAPPSWKTHWPDWRSALIRCG